jgi:nitroreductase
MDTSKSDPWTIEEADYPATGTAAERWAFLLRYALLAPSSHNTQPWRFTILSDAHGDTLELRADRTRSLPVADPEDRELTISCGAALANLRLTMRHFGLSDETRLLPDPTDSDLLAHIAVAGAHAPTPAQDALFRQIPRRHTNRQPFDAGTLPPDLLVALATEARAEGAWLHVVATEAARSGIADLIAEGDRQQWDDPAFRHELASWLHPARSGDGLAGYSLGIGPLIVRAFDLGDGQAATDHDLHRRRHPGGVADCRTSAGAGTPARQRGGCLGLFPQSADPGRGVAPPPRHAARARRLPPGAAPPRLWLRTQTGPAPPGLGGSIIARMTER